MSFVCYAEAVQADFVHVLFLLLLCRISPIALTRGFGLVLVLLESSCHLSIVLRFAVVPLFAISLQGFAGDLSKWHLPLKWRVVIALYNNNFRCKSKRGSKLKL